MNDDDGSELAKLRRRVYDLTDIVRSLIGTPPQPTQPPQPRRWAERATDDDWRDLITWVHDLNDSYSLRSEYLIPDCWLQHPGVIEEFAGPWGSWTGAVITDHLAGPAVSTALTAWHEQSAWPALRRIQKAITILRTAEMVIFCRSSGKWRSANSAPRG